MGEATILCVDDDPLVREVTQATLERAGFEVLLAADGREALEAFRGRSNDIALVLLDWVMPGLDGHDTVEQLKRTHPGARILLTSGYTHVAALPLIAKKQVEGFVQKPYLPSQLLRKVRQALAMEQKTARASS